MKTVLVSGASGIVGYGVLRSLRKADPNLFLLGSSIHDDSIASEFCDEFCHAPMTGREEYLPWLLELIRSKKIDLLIPGIEDDLYKWSDHRELILQSGATPALNNQDVINLCKDKWHFYTFLSKSLPRYAIESKVEGNFETLSEAFGTPFLMKPRRGYGSRGIIRVENKTQFEANRYKFGTMLIAQPIVGHENEEFTTSVFCDHAGKPRAMITMRRKLAREGFTDRAEVDTSGLFDACIEELCQLISPVGPTNFQFRLTSSGPKLLEINPRISSSTSIRTGFGFNESKMTVDFYLDNVVPIQPLIQRGRAIRFVDERVIFEDRIHF